MSDIICNAQEELEAIFRKIIDEFIPQTEQGKLDAMLEPAFVDCSLTDKRLRLSFPNREWMRNPAGNMHGGIIASAFDLTMGSLSIGINRMAVITPTVSMEVSYLRPVPKDSRLTVEAVITHQGRTLIQMTAKAWLDSKPDSLAATATATYYISSSRKE